MRVVKLKGHQNNMKTTQQPKHTTKVATQNSWVREKVYFVSFTDLNPAEPKYIRNVVNHRMELASNDYHYEVAMVNQEELNDLKELQKKWGIMDLRIKKSFSFWVKRETLHYLGYSNLSDFANDLENGFISPEDYGDDIEIEVRTSKEQMTLIGDESLLEAIASGEVSLDSISQE